jgi:NAD(P)-dependent dehydrogenase (short-subunit alcohol dehydrogenase family)
MNDLNGKSIVITGGGSGIGRKTALLLAGTGCRVTVADVNERAAAAVVSEIQRSGGEAHAVGADVAVEDDVRALVGSAVNRYGRLDGACNAAAICQKGKIAHEITTQEWDACLGINLRGLFFCNKYQVMAMLATGAGSIVNIASTVSVVGVRNAAEYCASKAGVLGLVRGFALDYATRNIRINAVLPGGIETPMLATALAGDPTLEGALKAVHPMNRFGEPREIAGMVRWLLSEEASFVTGAAYAIDGGMTAI